MDDEARATKIGAGEQQIAGIQVTHLSGKVGGGYGGGSEGAGMISEHKGGEKIDNIGPVDRVFVCAGVGIQGLPSELNQMLFCMLWPQNQRFWGATTYT